MLGMVGLEEFTVNLQETIQDLVRDLSGHCYRIWHCYQGLVKLVRLHQKSVSVSQGNQKGRQTGNLNDIYQ